MPAAEPLPTRSEPVEFANARGQTLIGRLETVRDGEPSAYAVFAHCFVCTKDINAASRIARGLAAEGIATLRFDFTGLGRSEGEFAQTSFATNVRDLVAAAGFLREQHAAPELMVGHSLGGAAAIAAAAEIDEAAAVATIGAPADPAHVKHLLDAHAATIRAEGEAAVMLSGREVTIGREFLDDLERHDPERTVGELRRPLLIYHAPTDATVGIENAERLYRWAKHPKSFISLAGADHLLTGKDDAAFLADTLAAWARRYVTPGS